MNLFAFGSDSIADWLALPLVGYLLLFVVVTVIYVAVRNHEYFFKHPLRSLIYMAVMVIIGLSYLVLEPDLDSQTEFMLFIFLPSSILIGVMHWLKKISKKTIDSLGSGGLKLLLANSIISALLLIGSIVSWIVQ